MRTTERSPPVVEYASVSPTSSAIEIRLSADRTHTSTSDADARANGTPTHSTSARTAPKRPSGSHACQRRKGSAISLAAQSTIASTAQLKTSPK